MSFPSHFRALRPAIYTQELEWSAKGLLAIRVTEHALLTISQNLEERCGGSSP
jgi:hypothetical protein